MFIKKIIILIFLNSINLLLFSYDTDAFNALKAGEKNLQNKDFTTVDLQLKKFYGVDFTGSDFTKANLQQTIFDTCTFDEVNFTRANISSAQFTNCSFVDSSFINSNFSNVNSSNTDFTQAVFIDSNLRKLVYSNCTFTDTILLRTYIEETIKQNLINEGVLTPANSIFIISDTHVRHSNSEILSLRREQMGKICLAAQKRGFKNKTQEIIIAGDLTNGASADEESDKLLEWDDFEDIFLNPFSTTPFINDHIIRTNILIGNHDRWTNLYFNDVTHTTEEINSYNQELIDETGETGEDYFFARNNNMNIDIYMLSECSARNGYKPATWFTNKLDQNKKCILVSHYSPVRNFDWWTDKNEPRENQNHGGSKAADEAYGEAVLSDLYDMLETYKNNIILYVGGHKHDIFLEKWNDILTMNCAIQDVDQSYALVHISASGRIVAIEICPFDETQAVTRYYAKDLE